MVVPRPPGSYTGVTVDWHPFWRMIQAGALVAAAVLLTAVFTCLVVMYVRRLRQLQ